tara:strand:- start:2940 stop:3176 length:237 start_codon:yes stop_codon:yes gene_type:complete
MQVSLQDLLLAVSLSMGIAVNFIWVLLWLGNKAFAKKTIESDVKNIIEKDTEFKEQISAIFKLIRELRDSILVQQRGL